jgi:putative tryptophan/tyrosine transport system substrate-binding protein
MQNANFPIKNVPRFAGPAKLIGRRQVLGLAGSVSLWPRAIRAQPMQVIGFLLTGSVATTRQELAAFWQGIDEVGFVEHRNIESGYHWADGHDERLPILATDLVRQGASVIIAGGAQAVAAAQRATATTPIVFVAASDPVRSGFVDSLSHPGANTTGVSLASPELLAKRLQVLHQLTPSSMSVAALVNSEAPNLDVQLQYLNDQANRLGIRVQIVNASGETDFGAALDVIAKRVADALVVANDGFLNSERVRLVELTAHDRIPAAFANREFVEAGGLMSYGPSLIEAYRQAGGYAGRILKGEKPADLPVKNPIELELAINTKTAQSFGLDIPRAMLAAADEVVK